MSPAFTATVTFAHRSNRNGTTDSVCRRCFATVATATWEAELDLAERGHACEPWTLPGVKKPVEPVGRLSLVSRRTTA